MKFSCVQVLGSVSKKPNLLSARDGLWHTQLISNAINAFEFNCNAEIKVRFSFVTSDK